MNETRTPLERAFMILGLSGIARTCDVQTSTAFKWRERGHLPRTDWTGETTYAAEIAAATGNRVKERDLLAPLANTAA